MNTMNNIYKGVSTLALGLVCGLTASCDDFIEVKPTGVIDEELAYSSPEKMTTAAYASLGDCWYTYPFNLWPFGDVASDDAFKGGSGVNDTNYHPVEVWSNLSSSNPDHLDELWYRFYVSISRCNRALISLSKYGEKELGAETALQRVGEVKFIRAHFYFKLVEMFNRVPWIDETVVENDSHESVSNTEYTHDELMQMITDEFQAAYDALPAGSPGKDARVNKEAAAAYLAKCYLYRAYGDGYEASTGYSNVNQDYMQKVIDYTDVVANSSFGYLDDFGDIFLPAYKNSKESVFAVQTSHYTEDNTEKGRANWSNTLNGCWGMWSKGWDFHKPSQNLVNAFKVGDDGLPMFDTYENEHNSYPVLGVASAQKYDPRLFHTVGMPSWPYKYETGTTSDGVSLTMTKDNSRNPSTYGYYTSLKDVSQRSEGETFVESTWQSFAMNDYVFRYTDVMLMRAEAMIETGDLDGALLIINDIRTRAKNSVSKHIAYAQDYVDIATYPSFPSKDYARQALRWERRLEMAMESSRFFDLRRWGMASTTLNNFFSLEVQDNYDGQAYAQYYGDAHFTAGKNEYFPIPYNQMFYVPGLYTQNQGYAN